MIALSVLILFTSIENSCLSELIPLTSIDNMSFGLLYISIKLLLFLYNFINRLI